MRLYTLALSALALALPLGAQDKAPQKKPAAPLEWTQGVKLLKAGKLTESLGQFRALAEKMPGNKRVTNAIKQISTALVCQKLVKNPKHPKYTLAVRKLNSFYTANGLKQQALDLLKTAWTAKKDPAFGTLYAHKLMAAGEDTEALEIFQALLKVKKDPNYNAYCAILLLRLRNVDEAKEQLEQIPKEAEGPGLCYNIACAYALMGQNHKAVHCLIRSFQLTPPAQLAGAKKQAQVDADLAGLRKDPHFAMAMKTASQVEDIKKGCAGCPSKGSCSKEKSGGCGEEEKPAPAKKKPAPAKKTGCGTGG